MKKNIFLSMLIVSLLLFMSCKKEDDPKPIPDPDPDPEQPIEPEEPTGPVAVDKTNPMKIYVHYMPWFETPETNNGNWGQHWTMANMNPNVTDADGVREIASHYYPNIGPYASSDKDVIEYHLLLMKYAGVDGVIIDWYGSSDVYDFGANRNNSEALIDMLDDVGLKFALTYEDWTLTPVVDQTDHETFVDAAIADFNYMKNNYFNLETYIKINDEPLLTVFGPQVIQSATDWTTVLTSASVQPTFLSLWYESADLGSNAAGEFSWVYEDNTHIQGFYSNQKSKFDVVLGSAYPGFKDFYTEGGNDGAALPWEIDSQDGLTFDQTLAMAKSASIDYLQIATWNDFGEGTNIEPALEYGYLYLEKLQTFSGTSFSSNELEYISKQYELRKSQAGNSGVQGALDQSFDYLVKLKVDEAKAVIDSLDALY